MSDLFHEGIPDQYIERCVRVMQMADWHTYQVLTKRGERLCDLLQTRLSFASSLRHVWWGVSVEDRKFGMPRVDRLREAPAAVRFLSVEPLLEDLGQLSLDGIHWVIVGGESGNGARNLNPAWVRRIREQCGDAGVPFFFKQWGGVRKSETGRLLDGRTYDAMPGRVMNPVISKRSRLTMISEVEREAEVTAEKLTQVTVSLPSRQALMFS
jgi:protein gp37